MEQYSNYYLQMNYQQNYLPPKTYINPSFIQSQPNSNRFVYVKQNVTNLLPPQQPQLPSKVHINPHFKNKVYVNPQFQIPNVTVPQPKPKIHVNPNFVNTARNNNVDVPKVEPKSISRPVRTVIATRTKIVRVPQTPSIPKQKIVLKRRNSLHSKYKIVRSSKDRFKLDKRIHTPEAKSAKSIKKRYVYVNRFLSISEMAKNVVLKQNAKLKKPGFVNINGILYKKSPNSLKKATASTSETSLSKSTNRITSKYRLVKKTPQKLNDSRKSIVKQYKLIRSRKVSLTKLKKCNIPCLSYRRTGKCKGIDNGRCIRLHNPDQIILCTRFLQGACLNQNCLLSHKVSHEKMPTCKYFLEGLCSRDDCPYLHVKISPKADICREFLEGFCKNGSKCDKRHQFLCPVYEKTKSCPKRRCPYPHGSSVRNCKVLKTFAKKCSLVKRSKINNKCVKKKSISSDNSAKNKKKDSVEEQPQQRYYKETKDDKSSEDRVINTISKDRPKLGMLPAFIPFNSESENT